MKILNDNLFVLISLLFLVGCAKKELEGDIISAPDFYVNAFVDGDELNLIGGVDEVFLTPNYSTSENGLPIFNTNFSTPNCSDCHESLEIEIIGNVSNPNDDIFEILPLGPYLMVDYLPAPSSGLFQFETESNNLAADLFNEGTAEMYQLDSESLFPFLDDGLYTLLTANIFEEISYTYTYSFSLEDGEMCNTAPQINISNNTLSFTGDQEDGIYFVIVNENPVVLMPGEEFQLGGIVSPDLNIMIQCIDNEGCFSESIWTIEGQNINNFNPEINLIQLPEENNYEELTVRINYTNNDGEEYVSIVDDQSLFDIQSISPYSGDPEGREAYLVEISAEVILMSVADNNDHLDFVIQQAIIPIVIE